MGLRYARNFTIHDSFLCVSCKSCGFAPSFVPTAPTLSTDVLYPPVAQSLYGMRNLSCLGLMSL